MLNGKQKSYLRSAAQKQRAIFQLGKGGLGANYFAQIQQALEKREVLKLSILQNSDVTTDDVVEYLNRQDDKIEIVQVIGRTVVIYKQAKKAKHQQFTKEIAEI